MMCIENNTATVSFSKTELEILFTLASERLDEMREDVQSKPKGKPDWCPIKALPNNISTEHERSIAELIHSNNMTCED